MPPNRTALAFSAAARNQFAAAVDVLPQGDRLLLALLYVEGFTLPEAALTLDMSVSDALAQHSVTITMLQGLLRAESA